jgi:dienelactone hydrolase
MKLLSRLFVYNILLFTFIQTAIAQDSPTISHLTYHKYEGNYRLENGKIISGGLMDEIPGHMVFIEPLDVSTGGLFKPIDSTTFQSYPPDNIQIKYKIDKDGKVKGLWWKEEGKAPLFAEKISHYKIERVKFKNGDITLSGELRLPDTPGPHPVIINVHGSGKQTRHMGPWNTIYLHYGIGILSYDKRGSGKSTGNFATAGYKDLASDVIAAVEFAKNRPDVDTAKIGLHGSSEGGWVSSIAASESNDISFMIIRAGSGVSGGETYIHEVKNELMQEDLTDSEYIQVIRFEREIQRLVAENKSLEEINAFIDKMRDKNWFSKVYGDWKGVSKNRLIKMRETIPVDPAVYLRRVGNIPVLWFLADKDENVPYELSKPRIKTALKEAGNKDFEIVTLSGANHAFFVQSEDGSRKYTEGYWDKTISWLKKHKIATGN